jgi:hypothetical protein
MKTLAEFTKTTLIGGILIILPIYVANFSCSRHSAAFWLRSSRSPPVSRRLSSSSSF